MTNISLKIQEAESVSVLSTDSLRQIINIINTYPTATNESNIELLEKYHNGDNNALELLIKTNMRLILKKAKQYQEKATSYQLLDLIQEVIIAFIIAAGSYDLENQPAKFSSYFMNGADFSIKRELNNHDKLVRRPACLSDAIRNYNRLSQQVEQLGKPSLSDEEVKKELNITDSRLKKIRSDYQYNTVSIDEKIDESDSDSTERSAFLSDGKNLSEDLVNEITSNELFIFLKEILPPYLYYILIMRIFEKRTLTDIAQDFLVTRETIRLAQEKAFKIIKKYCSDNTAINYKINKTINLEDMRCSPIYPDDIIKYMFFRDLLTDKERSLLKLYINGDYKTDDYVLSKYLNIDLPEFDSIKQSLFRKLNNTTPDMDAAFNYFKDTILRQYGTKIYDIDWDMDLEEIHTNIRFISAIWNNKSYEEVLRILKEKNITISQSLNMLLEQYFAKNDTPPTYGELRKAEQNINNIIFGFKKKNDISLDKLYKTALDFEDEFTEEQFDYLMMKLFNRMSMKDFRKKYPYSPLINSGGFYVIARLEALYYNLANYKKLNFTKKKYFQVRKACTQLLNKEQVAYLDLYFGHNCKKHSVFDIQRLLKIKYEEARDKLQNAKDAAQSIYLEKSNKKIIDTDYYIPYILDENVDLNDTHRALLKGYLIDKLSYDQLSKNLGMSKHDVSSNILDGLMKIDFYRFGILRKYEYPKHIIQRAIGSSKFSVEERKVLQDLQQGIPYAEVAQKHGKTTQNIETLRIKFASLCHSIAVENKNPTREELERELNIHQAANLLNENERIILSYTYGIKCNINKRGRKLDKNEFKDHFPKISGRYSKLLKSGIDTIIGKRLGIDHATLDITDRNALKRTLLDPRLPISDKERELLCYTYELQNHKYKDLNQLARKYKENASSIKRRIQRAIVTINRYENGEIQSQISYEYDVEGNLRFFTKKDREILISKYRDNLTYDQIAKKYGLTYSQTETLLNRLDNYLRDILDEEIVPFDFDYYYEVVDLEDFPYYDNLEKAKTIFNLYFEERLSAKEIKDKLKIDISVSTIQRTVQDLMIATMKRKDGIKKANYYSYDDVIKNYKNNSKDMDRELLESYHRYFKKVDTILSSSKKKASLKTIPIGPAIILDLIRTNNENAFSFKHASKDEAISILLKHRKELSRDTINTIAKAYNIKGRECMETKDRKKVLRFLSSINLQIKASDSQTSEEFHKPKIKSFGAFSIR